MTENKSFQKHNIKIGSAESRIKWGLHRLAKPEIIDELLTHEGIVKKEKLQQVELTLPVYFAGKTYVDTKGAIEHVGHPQLVGYYKDHIATSRWVESYLNRNNRNHIDLEPKGFSEPRYRIFGVQGDADSLSAYNIEWHTEGDWDKERGREASSARQFGSTELRLITTDKAIDLLSHGYDLWSKLANTPNIIWVNDAPYHAHNRNIEATRFNEPATEKITLDGGNSLWNNDKWLSNDTLMASLANAHLALEKDYRVLMSKSGDIDMQEATLIGQALSQMFAAKRNRLIRFVTDRGILGFTNSQAFNLTFTREYKPAYLQTGDYFINPQKCTITDWNSKLVADMRKTFTQPLPIALEEWKKL